MQLKRRNSNLLSGSKTDRGKVRENNEDSLFVDNNIGFYMIADGMGGQNAGEIASQMAVETLSQKLSEKFETIHFSGLQSLGKAEIMKLIRTSLLDVNSMIREFSIKSTDVAGMGTTVVLAICFSDVYYIVNLGDSRAYLWSANHGLKVLTKDHTMENELISLGYGEQEIDPQYKHMLTRWLGSPKIQASSIHIRKGNWHKNDCLLMCSDGLTNMLTDAEIRIIIEEHIKEGSQAVCNFLVENGILKGGHDNITTIFVQNKYSRN